MLGVFAEFETNIRKERQLEGIAAAKAAGVYKGRKAIIDAAEVRRLARCRRWGDGDRRPADDRPRERLPDYPGTRRPARERGDSSMSEQSEENQSVVGLSPPPLRGGRALPC